jgi:putative NADH-flavin reductase
VKLLVVGAAGKTGQHLVQKALAQGHEVTALVRSEYPEDGLERLRIVKGDARSEADLIRAMQGQDAVVSALGSEKAADELIKRFTQSLIGAARVTGRGAVHLPAHAELQAELDREAHWGYEKGCRRGQDVGRRHAQVLEP